jgi:hypothetical protein
MRRTLFSVALLAIVAASPGASWGQEVMEEPSEPPLATREIPSRQVIRPEINAEAAREEAPDMNYGAVARDVFSACGGAQAPDVRMCVNQSIPDACGGDSRCAEAVRSYAESQLGR